MSERSWWRTWLELPPPGTWHRVQHLTEREPFQRLDRWRLQLSVGDAESLEATVLAQPGIGPAPIVVVPTDTVEAVTGTETSDEATVSADSELTPEQRVEVEYRETQARRHVAVHLAKRGFVTVCAPWRFGEPEVTGPEHPDPSYAGAAERFRRQNPSASALGTVLADLDALLEAITKLPVGDPGRIGCYGTGVGAKIGLHLAALDERIQAAVLGEIGLGFEHSNWSAPWFYGDNVPLDRDLHELLAMIPPREVLLLVGDRDDSVANGYQRDLARREAGRHAELIAELDHTDGYAPPWPVLKRAYDWLEERL